MRAAVCRAFGEPLTVEEVAIAPPGPFQLAVRIAACAICHSDLAYAAGAWGGALPAVYGHEAAGRVTAAGAGVRGFAPGDFVLVTLIRACGACPACAGGAPTSCDHAWDKGESPLRDAAGAPLAQGMSTAAFAEAVVVDASQCVRLPADLPADLACLLACGVITGVGAVVNAGRMAPGASVAVVGAGGVGLNAVQGASDRRRRADRGGRREPGEARRGARVRRHRRGRRRRRRRRGDPGADRGARGRPRGGDRGRPGGDRRGGGLPRRGRDAGGGGDAGHRQRGRLRPDHARGDEPDHHRRAHGPRGAGARRPLADRPLAGGAAEARRARVGDATASRRSTKPSPPPAPGRRGAT